MLNINIYQRTALEISEFEFLSAFKKKGEPVFFRYIQEVTGFSKNDDCIFTEDDPLEYSLLQQNMKKHQRNGYGIYFNVNSGGTKLPAINRINAHFIDMDFGKVPLLKDGIPVKIDNDTQYEYRTKEEIENYKIDFIKRLNTLSLETSIVVETKNGFHVYWLLDQSQPQQLGLFSPLEEELCKYFAQFEARVEHVDLRVKDLTRVLRIIHYLHLKNPNDPFLIKCIYFNPDKRYSQEELARIIGVNLNDLTPQIIEKSPKKKKSKKENNSKSTKSVVVPEQPKISYNRSALDYSDLIPFLRSQDIRDVLDSSLPLNQSFNCIFHEDKHPSAIITYNGNEYKYFCNSSNCSYNDGRGLDIIDIVKLNNNFSTSEAIKYLIDYYNITATDLDWCKKEEIKCINNLKLLQQDDFINLYPNLNSILRYAYPTLFKILEIGQQCITNKFLSIDDSALFFFSNRFLAKNLKKSLARTNQYVNLLCILGLLKKVPIENVNETVSKKAKSIAAKQGRLNTISFYTIPNYTEILDLAEERASLMKSYRFSIKGMSKKYVENLFGLQFAEEIYHVKIKDKHQDIRDKIEEIIVNNIRDYGYCTKDIVFSQKVIINDEYISPDQKDYEFRKTLADVLNKYDLVYIKANKKINSLLGIDTKKYLMVRKNLINNI